MKRLGWFLRARVSLAVAVVAIVVVGLVAVAALMSVGNAGIQTVGAWQAEAERLNGQVAVRALLADRYCTASGDTGQEVLGLLRSPEPLRFNLREDSGGSWLTLTLPQSRRGLTIWVPSLQ